MSNILDCVFNLFWTYFVQYGQYLNLDKKLEENDMIIEVYKNIHWECLLTLCNNLPSLFVSIPYRPVQLIWDGLRINDWVRTKWYNTCFLVFYSDSHSSHSLLPGCDVIRVPLCTCSWWCSYRPRFICS